MQRDCRWEYVCLRRGGWNGVAGRKIERERNQMRLVRNTQAPSQWSAHYLSLTVSFSKPLCPNVPMRIISQRLFEYQPHSSYEIPKKMEYHPLRLQRNTYLLKRQSPSFNYLHPGGAWIVSIVLSLQLHAVFWKLSLPEPTWHLPLFGNAPRLQFLVPWRMFLHWIGGGVISVQMTQLCMGFIFSVCSVGSGEDGLPTITQWCLIKPFHCSHRRTKQKASKCKPPRDVSAPV